MPLLMRRPLNKYERRRPLSKRSSKLARELDESLAALEQRDTSVLDCVHWRDKMLYRADEMVQITFPLFAWGVIALFALMAIGLTLAVRYGQ